MTIWEGHKAIPLEIIENARVKQIHDETGMTAEIETVAKMNAPVLVFGIVLSECLQNAQFDFGCITVFLHRSDHLHSNHFVGFAVEGLHDLAKSSLTEEFADFI